MITMQSAGTRPQKANLLRISDIIKEVKRQIGSLQRQAGKARRYQALLSDLQVLDKNNDLFADADSDSASDLLDDMQVQQDVTANP